jgi:4-amino-4-deoxy-L-arabinose transferase-like glycosyltransferase
MLWVRDCLGKPVPVTEKPFTVLLVEQQAIAQSPITKPRRRLRRHLSLAAALVLFFAAGCLIAPMVGLQHDELLFADSVLRPDYTFWHVTAGHFTIPVMMNSYLGALKGWLFAPLFAAFGYREAIIRIPALLLAGVTIVLIYRLLREIAGNRAGLFGAWLLATDVTFLVTATFDWGPVVIQNLLLVLGLLLFVLWWRKRQAWLVFAAGFVWGLALWDKALFLWNFSAMAVMFTLLQPRFFLDRRNLRCALPVALGLVIGALPLICYNIHDPGATLESNTHLTTKELKSKFEYLRMAMDGSVAATALSDVQHPAQDRVQRPLAGFARWWNGNSPWESNSWRQGLLAALLPIGLVCAPPARRKWIVFFAGSAAIAWLQSALTINAGGSIHHSVLIWPLLYSGAAISADAAARSFIQWPGRWGAGVVCGTIGVFCFRGLFLINHAYWVMLSYSPAPAWSNADAALVSYLHEEGVHRAAALDWAIANPLVIRSGVTIAVLEDSYSLLARQSVKDDLLLCSHDPACVVVTHPDTRQLFPGVNETARAELAGLHLRMTPQREIADSHGTPAMEVFRLESATGEGGALLLQTRVSQSRRAPGASGLVHSALPDGSPLHRNP